MIRIAGRRYEVEWGHLLVATLIIGACIWYLLDARGTSLNVQNLILVQPATIVAVLLYLLILPQCVHRVPETPPETVADPPGEPAEESTEKPSVRQAVSTGQELLRVGSLAAAFGVFVFSMESLGFDAAAWIFTAVGLFICGERRWLVLALFPPVFALLVVLGYQQLIPYPIPTLIL